MGNSTEHFIAGAIVASAAAYCLAQKSNPDQPPEASFVFGWGLMGGLIALVPDCIEPATCWNHRGFFHSLVAIGLVGVLDQANAANPHTTEEQKKNIRILSLAYLSHLLLDSTTPAGLPIT